MSLTPTDRCGRVMSNGKTCNRIKGHASRCTSRDYRSPTFEGITIGTRFGFGVTVSEPYLAPTTAPSLRGTRRTRVDLRCDCGAFYTAWTNHLRSGHTTSCGCRRREVSAENQRIARGISPDGNCGTPGCTGIHNTNHKPWDEICPRTRSAIVEKAERWTIDHPVSRILTQVRYNAKMRGNR